MIKENIQDVYAQIKPDERDFIGSMYKGVPLGIIIDRILQLGRIVLTEKRKKYHKYHDRRKTGWEEGYRDRVISISDDIVTHFQREDFESRWKRCYRRDKTKLSVLKGENITCNFYKLDEDIDNKGLLPKLYSRLKLFRNPRKRFLKGTNLIIEYDGYGGEIINLKYRRDRYLEEVVNYGNISSVSGEYHPWEDKCTVYGMSIIGDESKFKEGLDNVIEIKNKRFSSFNRDIKSEVESIIQLLDNSVE